MTAFMRRGLGTAILGMIGVEQDAGAERLVISEKPRYLAFKTANINAHTHVELEERDDVGDGGETEPQPLAELVCIILGLFTRPTAFVLSGMMAVAYWMFHAPSGLYPAVNGGDAAILFCFIFLYLVTSGPGAWSLDGAKKR